MKSIVFIVIILLAGAMAGTILGVMNQVAVEPYIERVIEIEMPYTVQRGQVIDSDEFTAYRFWQTGGEIVAGTILGLSIGSLFGIVFAYTHSFNSWVQQQKEDVHRCRHHVVSVIFDASAQVSCKTSCSRRP